MASNRALLRPLLLGGAALYALSLLWYLLVGPFVLDLSSVLRLDDLRNTLVLFVVATLMAVGFRYLPAPWAKGSLFFEVVAWLQLPMILWYAGFGPFVWDVPLVIRTAGPVQPALVTMALLVAAWRLPPLLDREGGGRVDPRRAGYGFLLVGVILFGLWVRIWNLGEGVVWGQDHVDAPGHVDAVQIYMDGVYRLVDGYPYFGMHFAEWLARFWFAFVDALNLPVPSALSIRQQIVMILRFLNVFYGVGAVVMVASIGRRIGQREAGLLAAFVVAAAFVPNQMAKYVGNDLPMSFFALLAVWIATFNLQRERALWYLLAGVSLGVAFACKYNAILSFLVVGALWLQLRRGFGDVVRRAPALLGAVAAFLLTVYAATPVLWGNPYTQLELMRKTVSRVATPAGIIPVSSHDPTVMEHLQALVEGFWRHVWMFEGLFLPLPVALGAVGLLWAGWRFRKQHLFIWLAPFVVFLVGKVVKPNAASYQFLNIAPLIVLGATIGLWDLLRRIPVARVRAGAVAVAALFLAYESVQDNSMWSPTVLSRVEQEYVLTNFVTPPKFREGVGAALFYQRNQEALPFWRIKSDYYYSQEKPGEGQTPENTILTLSYGQPQSHTFWRDYEADYWIRESAQPLFFPMGHYPKESRYEAVMRVERDLVVTGRAFMTRGPAPRKKTDYAQIALTPEQATTIKAQERELRQVTRLFLAPEGLPTVYLWGRNCSAKENALFGEVGGIPFDLPLAPQQSFVREFAAPKNTPLYYGGFVEVTVGSLAEACWSVATTPEEIGRALLAEGRPADAFPFFRKGVDLQSLLFALLTAPEGERGALKKAIMARYPATADADWWERGAADWQVAAGYSDWFFASRLEREQQSGVAHDGEKTPNGIVLNEGGFTYGPHIPLTEGEYDARFRWVADGVTGVTVDVVSRFGLTVLAERKLTKAEIAQGEILLPFTVASPLEGPVELRASRVTGGKLALTGVATVVRHDRWLATFLSRVRPVWEQTVVGETESAPPTSPAAPPLLDGERG